VTRPETSPRAGSGGRPPYGFTDLDFDTADRVDGLFGISAIGEERQRELLALVRALAEADHVIAEVRAAMRGPYGGLLRLAVLRRRSARAVARVTALNGELQAKLEQVVTLLSRGDRAAEILRDRLHLHLEAEAELVAGLSPERRAVVDSLRVQPS